MTAFWEELEQVERFAAREPDVRLREVAQQFPHPEAARVLDLGCAAGRNAVLLASLGFDLWAVDSSGAMVEETRRRVAAVLGEAQAERRVKVGTMDRLEWAASASFDLVVALGIYHQAQSTQEWERAIAESARVLKAGGRCLVSVFTPETDLTGEGLRAVPGQPRLYEGFPGGGRVCLVDAATLDRDMARHGLLPVLPAETVRREEGGRRRVSANGLYRKA